MLLQLMTQLDRSGTAHEQLVLSKKTGVNSDFVRRKTTSTYRRYGFGNADYQLDADNSIVGSKQNGV